MKRALAFCVLLVAACKARHTPPPPPMPIVQGLWSLDPLPNEMPDVRAVAGSSATDVWAVGRKGIYHYDGSVWSDSTPESLRCLTCTLRSVSVVSNDDVWAVGDEGRVAHFDGKSWSITQPTHDDLTRVVAWHGEVVANMAWGKGLIRFDGKTWSPFSWPDANVVVADFWGTSSRDLWVPGKSAHHFDGSKWVEAPPLGTLAQMYAVGGSAPDEVWMVGSSGTRVPGGRAHHFDGTTWKDVDLPRTGTLHAVWVVSPKEAYAVGLVGSVLGWDGAAWRAFDIPEDARFSYSSVYSPGNGVVFATSPQSRFVLHHKPIVVPAVDAGPL